MEKQQSVTDVSDAIPSESTIGIFNSICYLLCNIYVHYTPDISR